MRLSILILITIALMSVQVQADSECGWDSVKLRSIEHVYLLPPEVLEILHHSTGPRIADVGEPYNSSDLVYESLPRTQFLSGYVSDKCAVVNLAYGGRASYKKAMIFEKTEHGWQQADSSWGEYKLRPRIPVRLDSHPS